MLEFVTKYWLQVIFGLAAACFTFIIRQYYLMKDQIRKTELENMKNHMCEGMKASMEAKIAKEHEASRAEDEKIYKELEDVRTDIRALTAGMLSVQGREFKRDCRALLKPEHIITVEEYESIVIEHGVYNSLGGNHRGDSLFKSVEEKWTQQLHK